MPWVIQFNYDPKGWTLCKRENSLGMYMERETIDKPLHFSTRLGWSNDTIIRDRESGYIKEVVLDEPIDKIYAYIHQTVEDNFYNKEYCSGVADIYINLNWGLQKLYQEVKEEDDTLNYIIELNIQEEKVVCGKTYTSYKKGVTIFQEHFVFIFLKCDNELICWPNQSEQQLQVKLDTYNYLTRFSGDNWQEGCDQVETIKT